MTLLTILKSRCLSLGFVSLVEMAGSKVLCFPEIDDTAVELPRNLEARLRLTDRMITHTERTIQPPKRIVF